MSSLIAGGILIGISLIGTIIAYEGFRMTNRKILLFYAILLALLTGILIMINMDIQIYINQL